MTKPTDLPFWSRTLGRSKAATRLGVSVYTFDHEWKGGLWPGPCQHRLLKPARLLILQYVDIMDARAPPIFGSSRLGKCSRPVKAGDELYRTKQKEI
jgi:hypothetical protein